MIQSTSGFSDPAKVRAEYRKNAQESIQQFDRVRITRLILKRRLIDSRTLCRGQQEHLICSIFWLWGKKIKPFPETELTIK